MVKNLKLPTSYQDVEFQNSHTDGTWCICHRLACCGVYHAMYIYST